MIEFALGYILGVVISLIVDITDYLIRRKRK